MCDEESAAHVPRIQEEHLPQEDYEWYLDLRRYGVPGQRVVVELERGGTRLERTVELVAYAGARRVYGFNQQIMGAL